MRNLSLVISHLTLVILFLSCQTVPIIPHAQYEKADYAPLDTGAQVYIFADVKESRGIIEILPIIELQNPQVKMILDRTDFIAAAVFGEDSGRRFQLTAWGKYPSAANAVFSSNKNWKKQKDQKNRNYWHSSADKLSLALNSNNIIASARLDGIPESPFAEDAGIEIPEGFNEFRAEKKYQRSLNSAFDEFPKAPFSCWLETPDDAVSRILNEAGVPIRLPFQKLFISLYNDQHAQKQYIARILFQFENISHARGTAAIINLAGGLTAGNKFINSLLFFNPVTQEGRNLEFVSAPLDEEDIINIFKMFFLF